ncbi:MAG: 3-keto-disaccharide hydrolase [Solirubrobacterales bacterium]|jgi:hypothetical protein|nr:3-keto-disaccharide hydrolase [Solirubrobacterales bacterium]
MILRKLKGLTQLRLSLGLGLCALFLFVSSAAAVVYVYKNSFGSKSSYNEIDLISGGKKCERTFVEDNKAMRIDMRGKTFCEYSPPVTGDADQPDHEIVADGRILDATPKNVRNDAYLAVRVRVGDGTWYEFRVIPKGKKYKFTREPAGGGSGLPINGTANKIKPVGENNKLRLRVTGNDVTAFVNGKSVESYNDPNPGQVTGRKVAFGLGSTKKANPGPVARFSSVKVGVPTP